MERFRERGKEATGVRKMGHPLFIDGPMCLKRKEGDWRLTCTEVQGVEVRALIVVILMGAVLGLFVISLTSSFLANQKRRL